MGRWIDRAVLLALTALLLYLLFFAAFGSVGIACGFSFLCCTLLRRICPTGRYNMTKYQAKAILERWAYGSDDSAKTQLSTLLNHHGELIYLTKHPTATLSMSDIFSVWKKHQNSERITVAAVCFADGRAKAFAATLHSPSVEIMDAQRLIPIIRRSALSSPQAPQGRQLVRHIRLRIASLPERRPWHRSMLTGLGLMLVYLLTGSAAYLALSIGSLFIAGISVRA